MVFSAWLARRVGKSKRKTYWWIMDLYPEALVANGFIRPGGWLCRLLSRLNEIGIGALDGGICLGERQRQRLQEYRRWPTSPDFCLLVPPWDYRPLKRVPSAANRFLAQYDWYNRKIALYAGNLGRGHTYKDILAAARELTKRGDASWIFVFVCRGPLRPALEEESQGLANVVVLDYAPPEYTADLLWSPDVHFITMADGWEGIVVPSKLYGVLQTDIPVLFIGPQDSDTAYQIKDYNAGVVLPNGCGVEAVLQALETLCHAQYRKAKTPVTGGAERIARFVTQAPVALSATRGQQFQ
jgi:hypothetical protein